MENPNQHAHVRLPPPLILLVFLGAAFGLNWLFPVPEPWASIVRIIGGIAVLGALILGFAAVVQMWHAGTSPDPDRPTTALVTGGPYRFTRNPIYLGFVLIFLGFTLLAGTLWGVLLSPFLIWAYSAVVIRAEEAYLKNKFPDEYQQYLDRARRWL